MREEYIGIIYNWKGLKEENYLYTAEELMALDPKLAEECAAYPNSWHESSLCDCAWKTWCGKLLSSFDEVVDFLLGAHNDTSESEDGEDDSSFSDWYWANQIENGLYGDQSKTMRKAIELFSIPSELCQ